MSHRAAFNSQSKLIFLAVVVVIGAAIAAAFNPGLHWVSSLLAVLSLLAVYLGVRRQNKVIVHLSEVAEELAEGSLSAKAYNDGIAELEGLAAALNKVSSQVRSSINELTWEKTQLATILSNLVEAVIAVDSSGRIVAINRALTGLFGVSEADAKGKSIIEVLRHNEIDKLVAALLEDHREHMGEVEIFAPDERIFQAHAVPLGRGAENAGALLVLHETTKVRKLENIRKEFIANVTHELRTPLAAIRGFAETLKDGAIDDKDHRLEFLEEIEKASDGLTRLVDDLLELSAIESGKRLPVREPLSLADIIREVCASLKPLADKQKVEIDAKLEPSLPSIRGDRNQLKRVISNLLDNAIKYSNPKGRVIISANKISDSVQISVSDTGIGIPSNDLPRVFERFYRVDKDRSRELGGTGLGLAIVKHIVELHRGSVDVESIENRGSTFRVSLPI